MKKYDIDTIKFCTDIIVSLLERRALEFIPNDTDAKWCDDMYISGYCGYIYEKLNSDYCLK